MSRKEEIQNAYQSVGNHTGFYDGMMTYGNLAGKLLCRLVWNMDKGKNLYYREKVLSSIPKDFFVAVSICKRALRERIGLQSISMCRKDYLHRPLKRKRA